MYSWTNTSKFIERRRSLQVQVRQTVGSLQHPVPCWHLVCVGMSPCSRECTSQWILTERKHLQWWCSFQISDLQGTYKTVWLRDPCLLLWQKKTRVMMVPFSTSLILSLLFMMSIYAGVTIALCIWVENPYIKNVYLLTSPETTCTDVRSGIITSVCREGHDILTCER